ncbi:dipeptidyl-peptidase 3 family protein [Gaetbulibacter aestuarii]|uniref:Dihydrofolate reductase n=1 Tax=Gaetbulibacter aestuarii TaxID=1502358 RepID=A0ABW7MXQ8_9FLAO
MNFKFLIYSVLIAVLSFSCAKKGEDKSTNNADSTEVSKFDYKVDRFADIQVLRYQIPGWDQLSLKEKKLVYYLTQAGLSGRDIIWDQNYRYNLSIRRALEHIYTAFEGDKTTDDWKAFEVYLKRVWFSNGIHHHYSNLKIKPGFSQDYLSELMEQTNTELNSEAFDVIFNDKDLKKVNLAQGIDNVAESAVNLYSPNVTNADVINFYKDKRSPNPNQPLAYGINAKLVKENGVVKEEVYKSGGLYGSAIDEIVMWLKKAQSVAENEPQAKALGLLIDYYNTGDLQTWDDYNVAWAQATAGNIDYINGFIEVYNDPLGYTGSFEGITEINDFDMSEKMKVLSENAQWFEDNSPILDENKKKNVVGVTYKVVNVAGESGDASPSSAIGVNLPNSSWIRKEIGSKSVSLGNIVEAGNQAGSKGKIEEFANDSLEIENYEKYNTLASKLKTALHEVVGHASGQINPGVGETKETLKNYASTLEEGRADLVALYYLYSPKLQELGLVDNWKGVGEAAYDTYIRNGLMTQLNRITLGDDVEEAHMRNRQWISAWAFEHGKKDNVIEKISRDGKTYFNITDYEKLRALFGELLRETQRIKSEGDYEAVKDLVETYGVKVDQQFHAEVLERYKQFNAAPYNGYVNPVLVPLTNDAGEITDIQIEQPESFSEQMLNYSEKYNFLPDMN